MMARAPPGSISSSRHLDRLGVDLVVVTQHAEDSTSSAKGSAAVGLKSGPPESRSQGSVSTVFPGALRQLSSVDVLAETGDCGGQVCPIGGDGCDIDGDRQIDGVCADRRLVVAPSQRTLVAPPRPGVCAPNEAALEVVKCIEVGGFKDDEGELDHDLVPVLRAETTVDAAAEPPAEGFQKCVGRVGILLGESCQGSNDPVPVDGSSAIAQDCDEGRVIGVPSQLGVVTDPTSRKGPTTLRTVGPDHGPALGPAVHSRARAVRSQSHRNPSLPPGRDRAFR
jgi:hypothetical protein